LSKRDQITSVDNTYTEYYNRKEKASGTGDCGWNVNRCCSCCTTLQRVSVLADTYTLATSTGLTTATSGNIVVSLAPVVLAGFGTFFWCDKSLLSYM
jgi:hypothetical protein